MCAWRSVPVLHDMAIAVHAIERGTDEWNVWLRLGFGAMDHSAVRCQLLLTPLP